VPHLPPASDPRPLPLNPPPPFYPQPPTPNQTMPLLHCRSPIAASSPELPLGTQTSQAAAAAAAAAARRRARRTRQQERRCRSRTARRLSWPSPRQVGRCVCGLYVVGGRGRAGGWGGGGCLVPCAVPSVVKTSRQPGSSSRRGRNASRCQRHVSFVACPPTCGPPHPLLPLPPGAASRAFTSTAMAPATKNERTVRLIQLKPQKKGCAVGRRGGTPARHQLPPLHLSCQGPLPTDLPVNPHRLLPILSQ
jgi:hypothetical protein